MWITRSPALAVRSHASGPSHIAGMMTLRYEFAVGTWGAVLVSERGIDGIA